VNAFKPQESDAYFYINDAMVSSRAQFIIDTARTKKLPTMFHEPSLVAQGALVSYGVSYHEIGRQPAKYVQRILTGAKPQNLPVESFSKVRLDVNLRTARDLGVTIPQSVLFRADKVVE
jgi:putative tryptophan/tyrosine transport system substrate-binding protein